MNSEKIRESSFELMRLVLMFMIIFWHLIINFIFVHPNTPISLIVWNLLYYLLIIHIDTFILLTGYFQSKKEIIGIRKIIKLNNQAYFYKIIILIIFLILHITPLSPLKIFQLIQPITLYEQYWFISIYILLYLISPYLNKLLNQLSQKEHKRFISILFIISSIIPIITNELAYSNNKGYSLLNFILMYSIGAYLRKYPLKKSNFFSKKTKSRRKLTFISIYIFLAIINVLLFNFSPTLEETQNPILIELSSIIINMRNAYNNPLIIIESIFFFSYFSELNIKSKIINSISSVSLDIYLIHDNYLIRKLYKPVNDYIYPKVLGLKYIILIFIVTMLIFLICIIIGYIRKFIFNKINRLKIVKNKKIKLKNKIDSLGFDIIW